jgi:hypothetical protein
VTTGVVTALFGPGQLAELHRLERQQKDNLCGCFLASLVLRAHGFESCDQDEVAIAARALLPHPSDDDVPPGASPRQDYRLPIPVVDDHDITGTSEPGLARAVAELSDGALECVPVAGPWSAGSVVELVDALVAEPEAAPIANVRTGRFWGSRPRAAVVLDVLAGRPVEPPPPDWDVGHFVMLAGVLRSPAATLVVVRDTYPTLGWDGYHLQPPEALAAALERGDGRGGGVLLVALPATAARLRERLEARLELRHWDNGTPYPP